MNLYSRFVEAVGYIPMDDKRKQAIIAALTPSNICYKNASQLLTFISLLDYDNALTNNSPVMDPNWEPMRRLFDDLKKQEKEFVPVKKQYIENIALYHENAFNPSPPRSRTK